MSDIVQTFTDQELADASIPSELPHTDADTWLRLNAVERASARRRLRAVTEWNTAVENGERAKGMAIALAQRAYLSNKRFYELASAFRDKPSLASLGLGVDKPLRRSSHKGGDYRSQVDRAFQEFLATDPAMRTEDMLRRLQVSGLPDLPSRATLLRWLTEARRTGPTNGAFGSRLVLDHAVLAMQDTAGRDLKLCALLDDGTGLLLGWTVRARGQVWEGYAQTVAWSISALEELRLGTARVEPSVRPVLAFYSEPGAHTDIDTGLRLLGSLKGFEIAERSGALRRVVRPLRRHLGDHVGPVRLLMGQSKPSADAPRLSPAEAQRVIAPALNELISARRSDLAGRENREQKAVRLRLLALLNGDEDPVREPQRSP